MARLGDGLDEIGKEFVLTRIIQMRGVDTAVFNFDFDLSWAGFFLNADLTVYGRYGTRRDGGDSQYSTSALKEAMTKALAIHKAYPANRPSLAPKNIKASNLGKMPEQMPAIEVQFRNPDIPRNCIHCHHVWKGVRRSRMADKKPMPDNLLWVYPMPDTIGVTIDVADGAKIASVAAGTPAAKAGAQAGDVVLSINGAPMFSIADFQFVLQNSPDQATLKVEVQRGTETKVLSIAISGDWRKAADFTWRTSCGDLRLGMQMESLNDGERKAAGLRAGGIKVKNAWPKGPAGMAGFQAGDVIVALNGQPVPDKETDFLAWIRQKFLPGQKIKLTVVRGAKKQDISMDVP
ncbi:MAG: PDZ/DHR/GLGF domain-containing [Planctomycetota bacterium]|nr:MAG: PDZ/DHR/GLGF domain-containing [Planctomycetota bacterium]